LDNQNPAAESLTARASRGAFWALASNIAVSAVSFAGTVVLARLLDPRDFGLLGMAVLVTGIVQLFGSLGLGGALIQKEEVSREGLSTVYWVNLAAGAALTLICLGISPLAAWFFEEDAVQGLLVLLSFTFFISSLSSIHTTMLYKDLRMKQLAVIEISSRFLRVAVMLVAACLGMGFWSLAIGMVVERILKTGGLLLVFPWTPAFLFSWAKFQTLFRYGRNLFGNNFLTYLNRNMDFLITGRVLGVELLGFYQMAYNLPFLLLQYVSDSIGSTSFPVFCKLQHDNQRLAGGYLRIVRCIALGAFPVLAGLAYCAEDFIHVVYGPRWLPAVTPLRILCLGAALASIHSVVTPLLNAKGRPEISFRWNAVRRPLTGIAILGGARGLGLAGVAWAMLVVEVVSVVLVGIALRLIEQDLGAYFRSLVSSTVACAMMLGVLLVLNQPFLFGSWAPVLRLVANTAAGVGVYTATVYLFFRADLMELMAFMQQMIRKSR
jgi:PST family polysaccharide transporter